MNGRRWARGALMAMAVALAVPPVALLPGRFLAPPGTPLMVLRWMAGEGAERTWVGWDDIAPHLRLAVIAAEDNRFCDHLGFDFDQIRDALEDWGDGERLRGASTISMQTARNLFLWPGGGPPRKALEAYATVWLELLWPKRRILEVYLNIAEWGPGLFGAEAAARRHFHVSAARLDRHRAALMAAVLPNPRRWSPARPTAYILRRAATLERRIGQLGPRLDCAR